MFFFFNYNNILKIRCLKQSRSKQGAQDVFEVNGSKLCHLRTRRHRLEPFCKDVELKIKATFLMALQNVKTNILCLLITDQSSAHFKPSSYFSSYFIVKYAKV